MIHLWWWRMFQKVKTIIFCYSSSYSYHWSKGKKGGSFERPYSVASDGAIDLERISNRGTLRYTPNRGYFIEEKKPLLQAKNKRIEFCNHLR